MIERAVLLIRRRRPIGEPDTLAPARSPNAALFQGSSGAGRVLLSLRELGVRFGNVHQAVIDPGATIADLDALDVGRLFVVVILGSHLMNLPEAELRRAYLRAGARHLVGDCDVLVEHHPLDWAATAEATEPVPGGDVGMEEVRRDPPFVTAVSTYDIGGRFERVPFRARVLTDEELAADLEAAGLFVRSRLSPTWLVAGPSPPRDVPSGA